MSGVGIATLDFGSTPSRVAVATVPGQAGITAGSSVEAWFMRDSTVAHSADEHMLLANEVHPICGDIVPGTGFSVRVEAKSDWTGAFSVRWVWSD